MYYSFINTMIMLYETDTELSRLESVYIHNMENIETSDVTPKEKVYLGIINNNLYNLYRDLRKVGEQDDCNA